MTHAEAIAAIKANWPTENYTRLREALTLACAALASPPAEDETLESELLEVAEALGMVNWLEGQGGYQRATGAEMARAIKAQAPPAATLKSLEIGVCSSNCGPVYRADEDGCCVTCGGDITFHDRSWPLGQTRCTVCRDTALPCQLGHTGRMLGPQPVAQAPHASDPPCQQCGGPHRFDTSVPSEAWNRVIRAAGLPDYLCAACVLAAFVRAGEPLDATLYGDGFTGERVALRVASPPAETEELPCLVENDACARCGKIHEWAGCCAEFPVDPDAWCENCRKRAGRASPAGEGGSVSG